MLREARRRKQQLADKIGHEEYSYQINGEQAYYPDVRRVRPQGNFDPRQAAGVVLGGNVRPSRPPYGVDDDAKFSGQTAKQPRNGSPLQLQLQGYPSPAVMPELQSNTAWQPPPPLLPALSNLPPPSSLPAPLPSVYHPKPPLQFEFDNYNAAPPPPVAIYPLPSYQYPAQIPLYAGGAAPPLHVAPLVSSGSYVNRNTTPPLQRLPSLHASPGRVSAPISPSRRSPVSPHPRPNTTSAIVFGGDGLSEEDERHRQRAEARRRALELQEDNLRQIEEKQRRRKEERQREIQEARIEEERLERERETVARREQAEVDREKWERDQKMMGPRAAQVALEAAQQRHEEERRAASRQRSKSPPSPRAVPSPVKRRAPSPNPSNSASAKGTPLLNSLPPPTATQPFPTGAGLQPGLSSHPLLTPRPLSPHAVAPVTFPQLQQQLQPSLLAPSSNFYETEAIRSELRQIKLLLEEQRKIPVGAPLLMQPSLLQPLVRPSSKAGAGTYLTTGLPASPPQPRLVESPPRPVSDVLPSLSFGPAVIRSQQPPTGGFPNIDLTQSSHLVGTLDPNASRPSRGGSANMKESPNGGGQWTYNRPDGVPGTPAIKRSSSSISFDVAGMTGEGSNDPEELSTEPSQFVGPQALGASTPLRGKKFTMRPPSREQLGSNQSNPASSSPSFSMPASNGTERPTEAALDERESRNEEDS